MKLIAFFINLDFDFKGIDRLDGRIWVILSSVKLFLSLKQTTTAIWQEVSCEVIFKTCKPAIFPNPPTISLYESEQLRYVSLLKRVSTRGDNRHKKIHFKYTYNLPTDFGFLSDSIFARTSCGAFHRCWQASWSPNIIHFWAASSLSWMSLENFLESSKADFFNCTGKHLSISLEKIFLSKDKSRVSSFTAENPSTFEFLLNEQHFTSIIRL